MVCSLACYLACCCLGCSLASWIPCRPVGAGWLPVWSLGDLSSGCVASWLLFWLPSCLPRWLASLLAWAACWYCRLLILVGARAHACIGGSAQSCAQARHPLEFDKRFLPLKKSGSSRLARESCCLPSRGTRQTVFVDGASGSNCQIRVRLQLFSDCELLAQLVRGQRPSLTVRICKFDSYNVNKHLLFAHSTRTFTVSLTVKLKPRHLPSSESSVTTRVFHPARSPQ